MLCKISTVQITNLWLIQVRPDIIMLHMIRFYELRTIQQMIKELSLKVQTQNHELSKQCLFKFSILFYTFLGNKTIMNELCKLTSSVRTILLCSYEN